MVKPNARTTTGPVGAGNDPRSLLLRAFESAVNAASAQTCLDGHWPTRPSGRLAILAAGKAAAAMAEAARNHYGNGIEGLVLVPDGHLGDAALPGGIRVHQSSHPVPDERSVQAADAALALAAGLAADDLLLVLLSGGGSSVMCKPRPGITLAEKQALTVALHRSGASIGDINCVRAHLSGIKGGQLAAIARSPIVTLAVSDVPGDDPRLIAAGPTLPTGSTPRDALEILLRLGIEPGSAVSETLRAGAGAARETTDRPGDAFAIVANGQTALDAAAKELAQAGYAIRDLGAAVEGDARAVARTHAELANRLAGADRGCCILSGGETTVKLRAEGGRGGRNTEYLLALAVALDGAPRTWAFAGDTDGIDGHGGHAGALLAPDTLARAREAGLMADRFLAASDSADFFGRLGDLVVTGPTRTNVNDLRVILLDR